MRPRITAAAGFISGVLALGTGVLFISAPGKAQVVHTCTPVDRQFIQVAQLSMDSVSSSAQDFLHGATRPDDVIHTADVWRANVKATHPEDPSLSKTRLILAAMFLAYSRAIKADEHHGDPGKDIYQAYSLANFAHDVLSQASAPLKRRGCDVSLLL